MLENSNELYRHVILAIFSGRRGLLLPNHLPLVVKVLLKALVYEETHGIVSAGAYVRDSACYTSWALARAYDPDMLKPYVNELAGGLLIVASFDREVDTLSFHHILS